MDCVTCGAYLGGGCCRDNLEGECRDGGHEAWRPREIFPGIHHLALYCEAIHGEYTGFSAEAGKDGRIRVKWTMKGDRK
ncbi:MAG: hypothetical protein J6S60_03940 [Oscillospiraceae bacterium]|nr:hypothetical protein [Oscillospiraceae bacterium]